MEALAALYSEPHEFGTVVIDSVDWLEPLIWKRVCDDNKLGLDRGAGLRQGLRRRARPLAASTSTA